MKKTTVDRNPVKTIKSLDVVDALARDLQFAKAMLDSLDAIAWSMEEVEVNPGTVLVICAAAKEKLENVERLIETVHHNLMTLNIMELMPLV